MPDITRTCRESGETFLIREWDQEFYKRINVPLPTLCPECRSRRRVSFRNQRTLYQRTCDFTGETMISLYSPDKPFKVYKEDIWWSDKWDPLEYGRDFDFSKPFFEQYMELQLVVPRRGMHQDGTNENCDYSTFGMSNKNGYLIFACFFTEDCFYCQGSGMSKDSMDLLMTSYSELCYECIHCEKCYNCQYLKDCKGCTDSYFLEDCWNCKYCIGCKNLKNKEYYIYNKKASKEEYEDLKKKLGTHSGVKQEREKFKKWKLKFPNKYAYIIASENCTGNYMEHAKNCHYSFDIMLGAEDLAYCQMAGWQGKDMVDCSMVGKECELLYEMHATAGSQHSAFTSFCRYCSDVYYCDSISYSKFCFGCIGLQHKQYCILNKQYTKEEYEKLVPRIIEHMQSTGEWGEFFPVTCSPFAYNETWAQEYHPMTEKEVLEKGWKWKEKEEIDASQLQATIQTSELPDSIKGVNDSILEKSIICEESERPFKIVQGELDFYRKMNIPIPHFHYDVRHEKRLKERLPRELWNRKCDKCGVMLQTPYAPDRPEIIYCEKCYMEAVL